jgi:hypothetical protein
VDGGGLPHQVGRLLLPVPSTGPLLASACSATPAAAHRLPRRSCAVAPAHSRLYAQVEAHFSAHRRALRLLADCPAGSGGEQQRGGGGVVSLGLVGDCMWMRDTWAGWASPEVRRLLGGLHAVVGNLETPLHVQTPTDPKWVIQVRVCSGMERDGEMGGCGDGLCESHSHSQAPIHQSQSYLPDMVTYSSPVTFLHAFRREAAQAQAPPLVGAFSVANNHSADMGPNGCASEPRA